MNHFFSEHKYLETFMQNWYICYSTIFCSKIKSVYRTHYCWSTNAVLIVAQGLRLDQVTKELYETRTSSEGDSCPPLPSSRTNRWEKWLKSLQQLQRSVCRDLVFHDKLLRAAMQACGISKRTAVTVAAEPMKGVVSPKNFVINFYHRDVSRKETHHNPS